MHLDTSPACSKGITINSWIRHGRGTTWAFGTTHVPATGSQRPTVRTADLLNARLESKTVLYETISHWPGRYPEGAQKVRGLSHKEKKGTLAGRKKLRWAVVSAADAVSFSGAVRCKYHLTQKDHGEDSQHNGTGRLREANGP